MGTGRCRILRETRGAAVMVRKRRERQRERQTSGWQRGASVGGVSV
jgi:hypothetical protein